MRIVELKTKQSLFKFTSVCDGRRPCVVWTQEDVKPVYRKALTPFHQAAAPVAGINNGRHSYYTSPVETTWLLLLILFLLTFFFFFFFWTAAPLTESWFILGLIPPSFWNAFAIIHIIGLVSENYKGAQSPLSTETLSLLIKWGAAPARCQQVTLSEILGRFRAGQTPACPRRFPLSFWGSGGPRRSPPPSVTHNRVGGTAGQIDLCGHTAPVTKELATSERLRSGVCVAICGTWAVIQFLNLANVTFRGIDTILKKRCLEIDLTLKRRRLPSPSVPALLWHQPG